jgi:signal transduction histidine kinase
VAPPGQDARRILGMRHHLVALVLMSLVAVLLVLSMLFLRSYTSATGMVKHTNDVRVHLGSMLVLMADAETAQRSYLLVGDDPLLRPYLSARGAMVSEASALKALTADNPPQQGRAREVEQLALRRFQVMDGTIRARRAEGVQAAVDAVRTGGGITVMDELRRVLRTMETEEARLLDERTARARWEDELLTASLMSLIVFASVFMGTVLWSKNREIDERRLAAEERDRLIAALERSNRDLDQFAYVASHDLKAPLRGIGNLSQWIQEDLGQNVPRDMARQLELMRVRVRRMDALIDGILSYSRAGRPTQVESVDVEQLVAEVVEMLSPAEGAVRIRGTLPVIETERAPLEQVFLNLIGNALKHASRPDPRVDVSVKAAGRFHEFAIADNGPGIAPAYHEKIWGIFQTLEAKDQVEGAGIGLSVVKKITEGRGGRAWVESAEGSGATFRFLWPKTERNANA